MPYVWPSDAWILLAVGRTERGGSGGCSLEGVIETRDHFDRVVFTAERVRDELAGRSVAERKPRQRLKDGASARAIASYVRNT